MTEPNPSRGGAVAPAPDTPTAPAAPRTRSSATSSVAVVVAGLTAAAGAVHLAMVPVHAGAGLADALAFAAAAWAQLGIAAVVVSGRAGVGTARTSVAVNLAAVAAWALSRTTGLPWGAHAGEAEAVATLDAVTAGIEAAAVVAALAWLAVPHRFGPARPAALVGAVAALGLATAVVASPEAASHGHDHEDAATASGAASAGSHAHGGTDTTTEAHFAEMAAVDQARCDHAFNPRSYWREARTLGVDTYAGGAMAAHTDATADSVAAAVAQPDPFEGRGSAELDRLIALTDWASVGEGAAARLIVALSNASDDDYSAWLGWLRRTQTAGHSHAEGTGDDTGGHGGHVGPQPWKAMTDREQCARLADELATARSVALRYPTVADAEAAGWSKVTSYVPGIAAHYMRFEWVDGTFVVEEPEMLLYDGTAPTSRIVGLSYYLLHEGTSEPSQGFTGGNDHFHRHVGLCSRDGVVVGDSTTTTAECAALGGSKQDGRNGWMSHAWVIPGCESPWGVFSAASPLFDRKLTEASGAGGNDGCAASGAVERYDLRPGTRESVTESVALAGTG